MQWVLNSKNQKSKWTIHTHMSLFEIPKHNVEQDAKDIKAYKQNGFNFIV